MFRSDAFNASGFVVQNCTIAAGNGTISIDSNSEVVFERNKFIKNTNRAIFVASNASLALRSCYFEGNSVQSGYDGGAMYLMSNVFLSINASVFYGMYKFITCTFLGHFSIEVSYNDDDLGNKAGRGGAIFGIGADTVKISSSNFSSESFLC